MSTDNTKVAGTGAINVRFLGGNKVVVEIEGTDENIGSLVLRAAVIAGATVDLSKVALLMNGAQVTAEAEVPASARVSVAGATSNGS